MDRVDPNFLWLICPEFADVFSGREALPGFEAAAEIVGVDEAGTMGFELFVVIVIVAFDSRILAITRPAIPSPTTTTPPSTR